MKKCFFRFVRSLCLLATAFFSLVESFGNLSSQVSLHTLAMKVSMNHEAKGVL